jgi:hypothetical protein
MSWENIDIPSYLKEENDFVEMIYIGSNLQLTTKSRNIRSLGLVLLMRLENLKSF